MNLATEREKTLFNLNLTLAILIWIALILGTFGFALIYLLFAVIFYLFMHSAFISHIKGNAVLITAEQFPDLFAKVESASQKLRMPAPQAYLMNGNGALNAFATKFMRQRYIVLLSDVVDAFEANNAPIDFYIGHELGHLHRNHLRWWPVFLPIGMLPLLLPAYRRACEYTCDQYGKFCSSSTEAATQGLALLVAGSKRWTTWSPSQFIAQNKDTGGFWMSFHELTASYPWLSKRVAVIQGNNVDQVMRTFPERSKWAYVFGLFCPGFLAGAFMPILFIYVGIILSAVAIPQFLKYKAAAQDKVTAVEMKAQDWTNPISGRILQLPKGFKILDRQANTSSYVVGIFSTDPDLMVEQILFEKMPSETDIEVYVDLIQKNKAKILKKELDLPTYRTVGGVKVAEYLINIQEGSNGRNYANFNRIWTHDGKEFWQVVSTRELSNTVALDDSEELFDLIVPNTL